MPRHPGGKAPCPHSASLLALKAGHLKLCYGAWNPPDVLPVGFSEGRATAHVILEKLPIKRKMNDLMNS